MDAPFQRARALDTTEALQEATITANDGSTRPLVKAGTSQDDLAGVAAAVSAMATAYDSLPSDGSIAAAQHPAAVARARGLAAASGFEVVASVAVGAAPATERLAAAIAPMSAFSWIEAGAGDLLGALESAGDYVVNIVKETGSDVWHFVASIAGKLYSFVFDAAGKVVAALTAVFRAIVAAIEDFILFLELLFEWNNILRTKNVVKKVVHLSGQVAVDRLSTLKADFDAALAAAQEAVNDWARIKADGWQASVDNADKGLGFESTVQDIGKILTAPSMFLFDHLLNTVGGSSGNTVKPAQVAQDPLDRALQFVSDPAEPLLTLKGRIESELLDGSAYSSLDLEKILSKLAAIVVDGLLETTTTIADTLLDALIALGSDALSALDLPVRIPLVSDILEDVFGIGIDFSMLDVLALVVAVPATIGYELLAGSAPFPAGDPFHDTLMKANAPADLQRLFAQPAPAEAPPSRAEALAAAAPAKLLGVSVSASTQNTLYVVGNTVAGVGGMIAGVLTLPAYASDNTMGPQYETALAVCKVFTSFSAAMATLFVDAFPIENTAVAYLADATNALAAAGSIGFAVAPYLEPEVDGPTYKKVAAGFDMFCALMSMSATCYHFYELSQAPTSADRAEACVDETATLCLELSRCAAFGARMTEGEARVVPLAAMAALTFAAAGLRIADGIVAATRVRASS